MSHPIHGVPCWVDLATPDLDRARAFYSAVLGWSFDPPAAEFGGYQNARAGGDMVAGMMQEAEGPSAWTVYLATDAIEESLAGLREAGATVLHGPHAVGPLGQMAVFADPSGAVAGLWQPGLHRGFPDPTAGTPVTGQPVWFEVNTPQGPAMRDLYAGLFGLAHAPMPGMQYWTLQAGGVPRYGVLQMTAEWGDLPAHWMTYFHVDDHDAALERVRQAGGEVCIPPFDTPYGRIAICNDPAGAVFTLIRMARPA